MNKLAGLLALVLVSAAVSCSGGTGSAPDPPPEGAVPLFENLGSHHHAVTTSVEAAQSYFDQGLRLVYGFNHDEAERAFLEAARLDPSCAMAWWGVAVALGPNINLPLDGPRNERALQAVAKAQALAPNASQAERDYIAAIAARYSADPGADRAQLDRDYGNAMKDLSARYPDDNDAAVLYAESLMDLKPWQLWTADGKPQEGTAEILRVLESVLAREPGHPGANHYYIHAIEASPNPEKGSASAERLKTLVPGAGHLVHMPAHIFIRTGNYQGAVDANADAVKVDEEYIARTKAEGIYPMMYYTHNFMFLSTAAGMLGKSGEAIESAKRAVAVASPMIGHEPMVEYVLPWSIFAMARAGKWDDVLSSPRPAEGTPSTLAFWYYARSLANLMKGDTSAARADREEFAAARGRVPPDFSLNLNRADALLSIAAAVLDARLASAAGSREAAIGHWKEAVRLQDGLTYDEPPAWYYPVRESLGGEYLRGRRFAEAEQVFREDLKRTPNNPRSLYGLREALAGQSKDAESVNRQFTEAWKAADVEVRTETL